MPITPVTTTTLAPTTASLLQAVIHRELLERAVHELKHHLFGMSKPVPMNAARGGWGKYKSFRKYAPLVPATAPLAEAITPDPDTLSPSDLRVEIRQYGAWLALSDFAAMTEFTSDLADITAQQGEQSGETLEEVYREVLNAGTNVIYNTSTTSARGYVDYYIDDSENPIKTAIRTLEDVNAKKIKSMIKAGIKIGTSPVRDCFPAIVGTYPKHDIEALTGFISYEEYSDYGDRMPDEFGAWKDVRFLWSSKAKVWTDSGESTAGVADHNNCYSTTAGGAAGAVEQAIDVFSILVFGRNAYAICPLGPQSVKVIRHGFEQEGGPLEQLRTQGWKAATGCIITEDDWLVRIETGGKN